MLDKLSQAMPYGIQESYSVKSKPFIKNSNSTNPITQKTDKTDTVKLSLAFRGYNGIVPASSIAFRGSLGESFKELQQSMVTCEDKENGIKGEEVGSCVDVNSILSKFLVDLPSYDDAVKTNIEIANEKDSNKNVLNITEARTQVKRKENTNCVFEMVVRPPRRADESSHHTHFVQEIIKFDIGPAYGQNFSSMPERAYILNTKGKLMAVLEDGKNVLLTNAGSIDKKNKTDSRIQITAREFRLKDKQGNKLDNNKLAELNSKLAIRTEEDTKNIKESENIYRPFEVSNDFEVKEREGGSLGGGTELVIGLEKGRFVPEIIDSIATFCKKVDDGEIVLDKFIPAENAQSVQIGMLAGGFGSRAEYTNASSSKIFHGDPNGSNLTKGCFRTATGLTPMETTFISLHKAGLLDCSKGNLGIGKNIKFYLNDSGENKGNGGFTEDMYDTMARDGRKSLLILPNDAMSRIPNAIKEATSIMNSGKAAMVMIAKAVNKENARGSLGIMKISNEGLIEGFAEKPKTFAAGYVDKKDNCFANTFQFQVSKEAFEALRLLEPYLPPKELGKESRDWSKVLTPVLMGITQNDDPEKMQKQIKKSLGTVKEFKEAGIKSIPVEKLAEAKRILGNQKIYAVKTSEPWADCGTLNALYHTTMQIASGSFPLEDFERKHVLDSVNTQTGLIASSKEQKEEIESKYDIKGQVMVVPKADAVAKNIEDTYRQAITKYSDKR